MRMIRADEKIMEFVKPPLERSKDIKFEENQTVVLCAGFEDRSLYVKNLLESSPVKNINVVLISYLPEISENNSESVINLCKEKNFRLVQLSYNRHAPAGFSDQLFSNIKNRTKHLWIDISGMTRLLIVQLLTNICQDVRLMKKTTILYCEAAQYPPTKEEAENKLRSCGETPHIDFSFLSAGIFNVAALPELATVSVGDCPSYLVAFPSFNPSQLAAIFENSPPSKVTLIHGQPPNRELLWRPEVIKKMNTMTEGPEIKDINLSTLHYQDTLNYLVKLYGEIAPFYNLIISPTGSKMQAVAVGLFRSFFKDVQILYPTHMEFTNPASYTEGVSSLYRLNLSPYSNFRKKLRNEYCGL